MEKNLTKWKRTLRNGKEPYEMEKNLTKWKRTLRNGKEPYEMEKNLTKWKRTLRNGKEPYEMEKNLTKWKRTLRNGKRYRGKCRLESVGTMWNCNQKGEPTTSDDQDKYNIQIKIIPLYKSIVRPHLDSRILYSSLEISSEERYR